MQGRRKLLENGWAQKSSALNFFPMDLSWQPFMKKRVGTCSYFLGFHQKVDGQVPPVPTQLRRPCIFNWRLRK